MHERYPVRLSMAQLAEAAKVCLEFGDRYAGVRERLEHLAKIQSDIVNYDDAEVSEVTTDLLDSVNPAVRDRILDAR